MSEGAWGRTFWHVNGELKMTEKQESIYSRLGRDLTAEKAGVWVDLDVDISVKVVSPKTPATQKALKRMQKPYITKIRKDTLLPEEAAKIYGRLLADHVIKDWKGFYDDDGKELKFSKEIAYGVFSNPAMDEVAQIIIDLAGSSDTFKDGDGELDEDDIEEANEDTEKNLKKTSAGS